MLTTNNECKQCIYEDNCIENPNDCNSFIEKEALVSILIPEDQQSMFYGNDTVEIGVGLDHKSRLKVGNLVIYNTHRFNWFERKTWKLLLGFDIENVEE